ncbi:MAG TPA: hypothetical protein VNJ04_03775 [Gemmatimonadaceae bacterium]|nr:hypothetical protein [Gemmatimonadaceae bacterium]
MKRTRITAGALAAGAVCAAALSSMTAAQAHDGDGSAVPAMELRTVRVLDARTVEATFSNPLASSNTDLSLRVFHAPHFDHDTPHSHEAAAIALLNGNRTARVTLARGLHPEEPACDIESEPRCSDDELPFTVRRAKDVYGQSVSDDDWDVWAVGSKN